MRLDIVAAELLLLLAGVDLRIALLLVFVQALEELVDCGDLVLARVLRKPLAVVPGVFLAWETHMSARRMCRLWDVHGLRRSLVIRWIRHVCDVSS